MRFSVYSEIQYHGGKPYRQLYDEVLEQIAHADRVGAFPPVIGAATAGVGPGLHGLASGVVNTSRMVGGALGLAVLATAAASLTAEVAGGAPPGPDALVAGFHVAYLAAAGTMVLGRPGLAAAPATAPRPDRPRRADPRGRRAHAHLTHNAPGAIPDHPGARARTGRPRMRPRVIRGGICVRSRRWQ